MTPAISVTGLTRRYRGQLALDHVTMDIEPESITGLLGRNGAGKTTLLRAIAGQEFPSSGTVTVLGANPVENERVLRRMVFVREDQTYRTRALTRWPGRSSTTGCLPTTRPTRAPWSCPPI
jgi:ABC-2 type transport system ATP-binding protein